MSFQQKENSASIFRNTRKRDDKDAEYTGQALIDGKHYWVNVWVNETKTKQKFFSCKFKPKEQSERKTDGSQPAPNPPPDEDDVPFNQRGASLYARS